MCTPAASSTPTASNQAQDLYLKHVTQAWTDQQASSDSFDNNLLTFSSAALGLSIAFIKDIVPLEQAEWLKFLYGSWIAFAVCIVVTVFSFQIAAQAQRAHTIALADYYLKSDASALTRSSAWSKLLPVCSLLGSLCLLVGIGCTLLFASKNVTHFKEMKRWQATSQSTKQGLSTERSKKEGSPSQ